MTIEMVETGPESSFFKNGKEGKKRKGKKRRGEKKREEEGERGGGAFLGGLLRLGMRSQL